MDDTPALPIASIGLPGAPSEPLAIPEDGWQRFLATCVTSKVTGLAVAAAEAGRLELTDAQAGQLLERHEEAMLSVLHLERRLLELSAAFDGAGIDHIVLKGSTLAHSVYPDPSFRGFGDLDILVRGGQWRRACAVLSEHGYRRDLPEPRARFDERFGKAATHTGEDGSQVDLHRTLVLGPFGLWLEPEELFDRTATFDLAGRALPRLADTALLLHACIHASLGSRPPLLLPVRDVAQVAHAGAVDWTELDELARRWHLHVVLSHAFATVRDRLGVSLPQEAAWFETATSRRRERRALEAYTSERRDRGGTAISTMRAIRGVRSKAAYVFGLMVPDRAFLEARAHGRPSYVRRAIIPLRGFRRKGR